MATTLACRPNAAAEVEGTGNQGDGQDAGGDVAMKGDGTGNQGDGEDAGGEDEWND